MRQFQGKFVTEGMGPNPPLREPGPGSQRGDEGRMPRGRHTEGETRMPVEGFEFLYFDLYLSIYIFYYNFLKLFIIQSMFYGWK